MVFKSPQHIMDSSFVCGKRGRCCDEDVIHIDNDTCTRLKVFDMQVMENMVHHHLECAGRIC